MNKQRLLIRIGIMIITVVVLVLVVFAFMRILSTNTNSDSLKFKNEYESFNGKKNISNREYVKLDISKNNPMKYSDYDELIDLIKNKTGIIYLGFPECPWCRAALPVLLDVAKDKKIDTIYYMDMKNERDSYEVQDGKLVYALDDDGNEIKGTEGYFRLLEVLDEYLSDYVIMVDDKTYEVGEKRIFSPSVIFVKEGKVLGIQVSTVPSQLSGYNKLSKEEYEELYGIYEDYISQLYETTCSSNQNDSAC